MSHHKLSPAIVSIQSKRTTRRHLRGGFSSAGTLRKCVMLIVGVALSIALSGCGVFCGIAGGFGGFSGFGGNCGIGFHF